MKKLLMLGTSTASAEMIACAKKMGAYVIATDNFPYEESHSKQLADEYWMISTGEVDVLEAKCRETGVNAVICGISEFNQDMALELCKRLDLPSYCDEETWHYGRNKVDFKKKCREHGVPVAADYLLSGELTREELEKVSYPVIVKPSDKSSNIGFHYCNNEEELINGFCAAQKISDNGKVVVEKLLKGREYGAYYALADGKASLLSFWQMLSEPGAPENCYSCSTTVTDYLDVYLKEVHPQVLSMFQDIGCRDGIVWIELMADEDGMLHALEMGHRLSGEKMWIPLYEITGFDSVAWMVNYALTGKNDLAKLPASQDCYPEKTACGYILWSAREGVVSCILGADRILETPGMTLHFTVAEGQRVAAYRYCAIVTFAADDCAAMCEKMAFVNDTIQILDENGEDLLIRYDQFDFLQQLYRENMESNLFLKG